MNKKRRRKALEGTVLAVGMSLSILTPVLAAYDPAPKAVQDHSYGQPQAATKEEISEMIASGIEAAIHCRESDGTWKIIKTNLDESHLAAVTVHGPDRDEAWISLNTTCFPEGYQEYSGLFDGQENARPIFRDFFKEDESQEQIFGLSMLMLYRNAAGKWETSSKENGIDLWCAAYLPHEELESASIEFHSDTTGKKYQIPFPSFFSVTLRLFLG